MTQATVEAGIVATIQKHADFDADNCKLYDRRPLGKGYERLVIVSYNTHRREELTIQVERRIWTYNVDVLVPWRGELAELDIRIGTETQKVIDILAQYPRLDGTADIQKTLLAISNTPDLITAKKGGYRGRRHFLEVQEIYNPSRAE